MDKKFELAIIGGGPAGYVASIRAAQLGLKIVCIEKTQRLGGTCLNVGCIPSKALLESSEQYVHAKKELHRYGIIAENVKLDLVQLMKHKESVVDQLGKGIDSLFRKNKVARILGTAKLTNNNGLNGFEIEIDSNNQKSKITAQKILLATGSEVIELPFLPFDQKRILSSTEVLSLSKVPSHLVVVGGGYVGLEMASVWLRLGSKVSVVEYNDRLLVNSDQQAAQELHKALIKQGMVFKLGTKCTGSKITESGVTLEIESKSGEKEKLSCEYVLVATGRKPFTKGLGLESLGIKMDERGRVLVDKKYQTNISGIYAVGDLITGPMLAHKASEEGVAAVEMMASKYGHVNYQTIPAIVYTSPELASVGATEEELNSQGIQYKAGVFPFLANARSKAMLSTQGFAKILADATTDRILGAHIVGPMAGELIHTVVSVMEFGGSSEDLARTCHAHPTLSEVLKEAALGVENRMIHF